MLPSSDVSRGYLLRTGSNAFDSRFSVIAFVKQRKGDQLTSESMSCVPIVFGGDPAAAADRLKLLDGLPLVSLGTDVDALANLILANHLMPQKAGADAVHVAAAAMGGVNYLLTLNCRHIANAHELPRIYELLDREGFGQLLICTPAEFLGDLSDVEQPDT